MQIVPWNLNVSYTYIALHTETFDKKKKTKQKNNNKKKQKKKTKKKQLHHVMLAALLFNDLIYFNVCKPK